MNTVNISFFITFLTDMYLAVSDILWRVSSQAACGANQGREIPRLQARRIKLHGERLLKMGNGIVYAAAVSATLCIYLVYNTKYSSTKKK